MNHYFANLKAFRQFGFNIAAFSSAYLL